MTLGNATDNGSVLGNARRGSGPRPSNGQNSQLRIKRMEIKAERNQDSRRGFVLDGAQRSKWLHQRLALGLEPGLVVFFGVAVDAGTAVCGLLIVSA